MNVSIDEIDSTVQVSDSATTHDPEFVELIVRIVLERLQEAQRHQQRIDNERQLWPGVSSRPGSNWT